jgi:hypothetical protein
MPQRLGQEDEIFRVERDDVPGDDGAMELHLKRTEGHDDSWRAIRWCLISVRGGSDGVRLFALQRSVIDGWPVPNRLKDRQCRLLIPNTASNIPIPKLLVKAVEIRLAEAEQIFTFEPQDPKIALGTETVLRSPIELSNIARSIAHSQKAPPSLSLRISRIDQSLSFDLAGGKSSELESKLNPPFELHLRQQVKAFIQGISLPDGFTWPTDPKNIPQRVAKAMIENDSANDLRPLRKSIEDSLANMRKDEKTNAAVIATRTSDLAKIDALDNAAREFARFKENLAGAEIVGARFYYDVLIGNDSTTDKVPIPFEFTNKPTAH